MIHWERCIAHLDLDAFYASVEEIVNPQIKGLPVIVVMGEDVTSRGAVATASYAARAFGVRSAIPVAQARKLCPDGVYLPVRHSLYREFSQKVMTLLSEEVPVIEQVSIDEAYLDLSFVDNAPDFAQRLQERISQEIGLTASVGVATNKLVAKMASGHKKPGGLTVVLPGDEASFLADAPVGKLYGVGPKTAAKLVSLGINTIGELAAADGALLQANFGQNIGLDLRRHAAGIDHRELETNREAKSLSSERTYFGGTGDRRELWAHIQEMAQSLEKSLQRRGLLARTISLKLRLNDYRTVTRAETLATPTDQAGVIAACAARLMRRVWQRGSPLRLLGVRVSSFVHNDELLQLELDL
jgi:DNA polymerase IV